jgi:hypothetical protein
VNSAEELEYTLPEDENDIPVIIMESLNILKENRAEWWTADKKRYVKNKINKMRNNCMSEILKKLTSKYILLWLQCTESGL